MSAALRHMRDVPDADVRRELLVRFMILGGLRYDKIQLLDRAMVEAWADCLVDASGIPLEELLST